ncbi:MAG TPA: PspC domain-containing protein [Peptococcaceae bacterium]|nr:PspC domain-containing protein [Peptococcaceae bacterium]
MSKLLYRSRDNRILAGVCSGIAEYFDIDPAFVRIIWLISVFAGIGIIAYIICWLAIPERSYSPFNTADGSDMYPDREGSSAEREKNRRFLGIALIIIGSIFMLDKLFRWFNLDIVIPLGIIALGLYILYSARRG